MARRVKVILNPMADMGNAWRVANDLRPILKEHGSFEWSGTVYPTHATEIARQAGEQGFDLVIAMGGDGTVHETMNGIMQLPENKRPMLGVVPVGSGNDFAHAMGVPVNPAEALTLALNGEPKLVDIGLFTDEHGHTEYFDNTIGMGFDGVVTIRSHKLPVLRGFLMYLVAVIQTILFNHDPAHMQIETDAKKWDDKYVLTVLCNGGREGGGFHIAPDAKPDDGVLNYTFVRKVSRLMMFRLLPEFLKGTHGRFKQVFMGEFKRMSIVSDRPLYIHIDGELFTGFGSNLRSVQVQVLPKALRVVRP